MNVKEKMSYVIDKRILLNLKTPSKLDLGTPAVELHKAVAYAKRHAYAQDLFARWPNLREATLRLTAFLSLYWPDTTPNNTSLLVSCLVAGFDKSEQAFLQTGDDLYQQGEYIKAISERLVLLLECTLMVRRNGCWQVHQPSMGGNVDELIRDKSSEELSWVRNDNEFREDAKAILMCASRVFSPDELRIAGLIGFNG